MTSIRDHLFMQRLAGHFLTMSHAQILQEDRGYFLPRTVHMYKDPSIIMDLKVSGISRS